MRCKPAILVNLKKSAEIIIVFGFSPAALLTEYAMLLPPGMVPCTCSVVVHRQAVDRIWKLTATDEVRMNTPPSGLAVSVGSASRKRCRFPLTLVNQHCGHSTHERSC